MGTSLKQDPLGGGIVPLGGRVGIDEMSKMELRVEDERENEKTAPRKKNAAAPPARAQRLTYCLFGVKPSF